MARPRKDKIAVGKPVAFRLPLDEYERFALKVKESGLSQSEYFRRAIIANEAIIVAARVETEDERRHLFLVQKASNNLNQLAHVMNYARVKGKIDRTLCIELLTRLDLLTHYLRASL